MNLRCFLAIGVLIIGAAWASAQGLAETGSPTAKPMARLGVPVAASEVAPATPAPTGSGVKQVAASTPPATLPPTKMTGLAAPTPDTNAVPCAACPAEDGCCEAPAPPGFWVNADYLLWWVRGMPSHTPLVSRGNLADPFAGVLGQNGTTVLFGNQDVNYGPASGFRFNGGFALDAKAGLALEGGFFWLQSQNRHFDFFGDATGNPVLGHPFINAATGNENLYLISAPAAITRIPLIGGTTVATSTQFHGFDVNLSARLMEENSWTFKGLFGYRNLSLDEELSIGDVLQNATPGGILLFKQAVANPPSSVVIFDSFQTRNSFHGGQLGGQFDWISGRFSVDVAAKIALGVTEEVARVNGVTALVTPGVAPVLATGGTYAQPSNIGRYYHSSFAVVPEVGLNLGYDVNRWLTVRAGYSFLYVSRVARPGDVDRTINTNQVPSDSNFGTPGGAARPGYTIHESDFWAQGVNLGVEVRY